MYRRLQVKMESAKLGNAKEEKVGPKRTGRQSLKMLLLYLIIYMFGIGLFFVIIAEPFTMSTYFSDNSLLPGLVNREFSLGTEAEYYLKDLNKLSNYQPKPLTLATSPAVVNFIKQELDSFGLEVYEQNFNYQNNGKQYNGTNLHSIIRGERSTSSESIVLCAPVKTSDDGNSNTLASVALTLALTKYFSTRSYWAKDVIILIVDHDQYGTAAWLDSYYDVNFKSDLKHMGQHKDEGVYYDSLVDRSGPMQAAIVLEIYGREYTRANIKIQGLYGQLPNLDLFNLIIELAARESVTPYFHNKSLPFALNKEELYNHHLETALSFMKTQATMQADGLHGYFLKYAVQSLTIECPEIKIQDSKSHIVASLLNVGRLVEGVFRSLNNLTERFNRSYYFYIILSLRRFTSIGYYMIPFGIILAPVLMKALNIYMIQKENGCFIGLRGIFLLASALALSLLSTINISTALISAVLSVPILIFI